MGKRNETAVSQEAPHLCEDCRNVIFITFDALTSRNMSLYGYEKLTTPFISKWAKKAAVFTRVEAADNFTTSTVASLMTGKRVWTHQTYHLRGSKPLKHKTENLPLLMKNNGYYTMAFVQTAPASVRVLGMEDSFYISPLKSTFIVPAYMLGWIDNLLSHYFFNKIKLHDWIIKEDFILYKLLISISGKLVTTNVPPENVFNKFIHASYSEPFFTWIHVSPPHFPYLPPEPYMGMFNSSFDMRTLQDQVDKEKVLIKHQSKYHYYPQKLQPAVDLLKDRYDEYIRYCDKQFKEFIEKLEANNILKNTVIILSADHGESFEHNYYGHAGRHLYEQVTHIPLIIKEPDNNRMRTINNLVEQIDIPATILDLAGVTVPAWMEGRSLIPLLRGEMRAPKPVFSMDFQHNASRGQKIIKGTIAVWKDRYKLIHYLNEERSLLFDLKKDPDELSNLFDKESNVGQHLLTLIKEHLKEANEKVIKGM